MRIFIALAVCAAAAGCALPDGPQATPEQIASVAYREPGPATLTVITMINNRTGNGGHTALMINGSQRLIFDPAGSFRHEGLYQRDDVLYGITPVWLKAYKSAHARSTFHVVTQEFTVTPEQAEAALQLAQRNGPVTGSFCTNATTRLLNQVPGIRDVEVVYFPTRLMDELDLRPDVRTEKYYENDAGDVVDGIVPPGT